MEVILDLSERGRLGARAKNDRYSIECREKYKNNPKLCAICERPIPLPDGKRPSDLSDKKYCSEECLSNARVLNGVKSRKPTRNCCICNEVFVYENILKFNGKYFCDFCLDEYNKNKKRKREIDNLESSVIFFTKKELFEKRKNWQSARSEITKLARKKMAKEKIRKDCHICSYSKHVEVCHIKPVSDFSDDSFIYEINSLDNLVYLCPNHHWELDNGFLLLGKMEY